MAQVMRLGSASAPTSMDKKTYTVNFKGLIAHFIDILFVESHSAHCYHAGELSPHIQRDIGLMR
ncbi:hypothetical protein EXA23_09175 [Vibrio cincinnatiensis]|uniref:Uncharacterized protein n=1 Tax=Vibrio cincinnatiensis DSM 19608 TaxID=1123491 RepID=A0A1T4LS04_VIBCI|nr:hypothetical protein [Vibrio cincinnatiensis]MCG3722043.1 hypothetical protein [Vibrio cincinnatiensis]MCG3727013.1 hypothetical protein [Vibrio cincinnatiensis]MCG3732552.1 hypothetical protein [Vibrio cincinnatiensis]MCG3735530.1 hypothetical protein [Vibrio cincinnatiensis]MCG3740504.1 hypothetical protein [Vibrio cincinnatiensis]